MVSLRGLTLTAARPRIIVPLFARDPAALCPLAKAASADPAAELEKKYADATKNAAVEDELEKMKKEMGL